MNYIKLENLVSIILFKNYLDQKDAIYRHRLVIWDEQFNFAGLSKEFSFLDGNIEFCVGAAKYGEDLLVSFGFQDNAAFILQTPKSIIDKMVTSAIEDNIKGDLWK